jgi:hypothetical protein
MNSSEYFEDLEQFQKKYHSIKTKNDLKNYLRKPSLRSCLDVDDLSINLINSEYSASDCLLILDKIRNWCESVLDSVRQKRLLNFEIAKRFKKFNTASSIFYELLSQDEVTEKKEFQYSVHLSLQLPNKKSATTGKRADTEPKRISKKNIRISREYVEKLISKYQITFEKDGYEYHEKFKKTLIRGVPFPAAFVWDKDDPIEEYISGEIEQNWIWFEFELVPSERELDHKFPIPINYHKGFEDSQIEDAVWAGIVTAIDEYNSVEGRHRKLISRSFICIGNIRDNYDGASIGAAAYFAAMSPIFGEEHPSDILVTGSLDVKGFAVQGIRKKIQAAKDEGYKIIVIPQLNADEIKDELDEYENMIILEYSSLGGLYEIWTYVVEDRVCYQDDSLSDILEENEWIKENRLPTPISDSEDPIDPEDDIGDTSEANETGKFLGKIFRITLVIAFMIMLILSSVLLIIVIKNDPLESIKIETIETEQTNELLKKMRQSH